MVYPDLVAIPQEHKNRRVLDTTVTTTDPSVGTQTRHKTPVRETETGCFPYIRKLLCKRGLTVESVDVILKSWRESTKKTYETYLRKWLKFTKESKVDPIHPTQENFITFLTELFHAEASYSTIGTARSAVNQFMLICSGQDFSQSRLVNRFMKGVYESRPQLPKYVEIWDVGGVLDFIQKLPDELSLMLMTMKLCVLFLLTTMQRCQTLHLIALSDIKFKADGLTIVTNHLLKQSKRGRHLPAIQIATYKDSKLCLVTLFQEYLTRTANLRGETKELLISVQKTHKNVARDTVSRWVKTFLYKAGVAKHYKAHSTRAASASFANKTGVPLETIMKTAGWANATTFQKFYHKNCELDKK